MGVRKLAVPSRYPFANASKISILKSTFSQAGSSSATVLAAVRRKSPKSEKTKDGIMVSKSMMQSTLPFSSNIMLLTFVSQWQMRLGRMPSRYMRSALHISSSYGRRSARMAWTSGSAMRPAASASTASCSWRARSSMLWKSGMVSPRVSGMSASIASKAPKDLPAK